jgi:hypothetical protein
MPRDHDRAIRADGRTQIEHEQAAGNSRSATRALPLVVVSSAPASEAETALAGDLAATARRRARPGVAR